MSCQVKITCGNLLLVRVAELRPALFKILVFVASAYTPRFMRDVTVPKADLYFCVENTA